MTVDVKARLVLEDAAQGALDSLKEGFTDLLGATEQTNEGMGFIGQTMSTMAAVHLPALIGKVYEFSTSLLDASRAADSADQALGGFISVVQDRPFAQARAEAEQLTDTIENMAIKIGQPVGEVKGAFMSLIELTGASEEGVASATAQIEDMTVIANVLGKNTQQIAQEFGFMRDGMVRTRGAMFQLLQTTGIFGDDATKASQNWMKITEKERVERLNYALGAVTQNLKEAAPTFDDLVNTVTNIKEVTLERFGQPIMAALKPELLRFADTLKDNTELIQEYAEMIAHDAAQWVEQGAAAIQEGFEWLKDHHEEIKAAVVDAFTFAKQVVEFILEHKEALAIAFGAKMALPAVQAGVQVGRAAVAGGQAIYGVGAAGTGTLGMAGGAGLTGVAGGAAALGAFSAALIGVGLAADQGLRLMGELEDAHTSDARARLQALQKIEEGTDNFGASADKMVEYIDKLDEALVLSAHDVGMTVNQLHEYTASLKAQAEANAQTGEQMRLSTALAKKAFEGEAAGLFDPAQIEEFTTIAAEGVVMHFQQAMQIEDEATKMYIARQLLGSRELQRAFIQAADMTDEGYKALLESVVKGGGAMSKFAEQLRGIVGEPGGKIEAPKFNMNFNGGQTFKINQEFRDADPDRVAMVFRRDVLAAAERRVMSNYSSPFGT